MKAFQMKSRPTLSDLAREAGVSLSTVNRIVAGSETVRGTTIDLVQAAAERIGYHGLGVISARKIESLPRYRLGFLLQQSSRDWYQQLASEIRKAAAARRELRLDLAIDFVDYLEPSHVAARLKALGNACDVTAVIAADHPIIGNAIRELHALGKPVVAYITDHSCPERAAFVGVDNWKLGRTAGWFMAHTTNGPGRVAVFIGHHRYQCQDVSDASFRSYLREHAPRLVVEASRPTHEEPAEAYRMVSDLLATTPDLTGILTLGGGISGVLRALREVAPERRHDIRLICRDIGPETRKGLSEELITAALVHPLEATSTALIQAMVDALQPDRGSSTIQRTVAFHIITPENV
jgi:LacI family transcriptional regulator